MTTSELIEHIQKELDPSFTYIERYIFIQIDTPYLAPNGTKISVFVTNRLPEYLIVSDSSYLADNCYFQYLSIPFEKRVQILQKWNVKTLSDETTSLYHVHNFKALKTVVTAINELIHCIQEFGMVSEEFRIQ